MSLILNFFHHALILMTGVSIKPRGRLYVIDRHLIKAPKTLWRDLYNAQIQICLYFNIHNLQMQTNFQNAQIW